MLLQVLLLSLSVLKATSSESTATGIMISGGANSGNSAEMFFPSTGKHCRLPDIPGLLRDAHSVIGTTICGGYQVKYDCISLIDGAWKNTAELQEPRWIHSMWDSPSGLIILGGYESPTITERIEDDGSTTTGFDLVTDTYSACVINLGATMLVTGGGTNDTFTRVTEYSESGYVRDLPTLNQPRYYHACASFENDLGTQTYLVTGGMHWTYQTSYQHLASTELLVQDDEAWTLTGELPFPLSVTQSVTVDNRIFLAGGMERDPDYKPRYEIFEFDTVIGEWRLVDRLMQPRMQHAVSVVPNGEQYCSDAPHYISLGNLIMFMEE